MNIFGVIFVALLPSFLVLGTLLLWRFMRAHDKRRSPLTFRVLNLPGEGLRRAIEKHDEGFSENAALAISIGPIVLLCWFAGQLERFVPDWVDRVRTLDIVFFGGFTLCLMAWTILQLIRHGRCLRKYRQGLAAELAVAQCLMPLMAEGLAVFHDFPADTFNIDHIVVGSGAVFAVETKSRKKPQKTGRQSARVSYDGIRLQFPEHAETRPIEQASHQAQWLQRFLSAGVGEPVRVIPVVALPGWYVENKGSRPVVLVSNCHNPKFMTSTAFGPTFSPPMRKRIAHVLAERYPSTNAPKR